MASHVMTRTRSLLKPCRDAKLTERTRAPVARQSEPLGDERPLPCGQAREPIAKQAEIVRPGQPLEDGNAPVARRSP